MSSERVFSGESSYLTRLRVFRNGDPTDLEPESDKIVPNHHQKKQDKIIAALKLLTFREQHVLVQFWSPREVGKYQLLETLDQPIGLGVIDEGLCSFRKDSVRKSFVVDEEHEEEDVSPAARVFRRGLPEWTCNLDNYTPKQFPQQECAILCNLHGYLALPVFDSNTPLCVGVLELLTTSKYTNYAYQVQQVHRALKAQDLQISQQDQTFYVPNERRQKDLDNISKILKTMCDIHSLPLAQTWAVSQHSSFVAHEQVIMKSCSSFDTRCAGIVCMSTTGLPFHVQDWHVLPFQEVCSAQHLDSSRGFVGKALLSRGSCFCGDVTGLSEEEYPLVHHARMNGLSSCFAISLHSVEANDDYVLEFFLPPDIKDSEHVLNLVQTLKQRIEIASGFELGDNSCIQQVVGQPIQIASIATNNNNQFQTVTVHDSKVVERIEPVTTESFANVLNQWQSEDIYIGDGFIQQHDANVVGASNNNKMIQETSNYITDAGEKYNPVKQGRKRKIDSLTMEAVRKQYGNPIDAAARSLGVSRSTLKRFCRAQGIESWPLPKHSKKPAELKLSQKSLPKQSWQRPSNVELRVFAAVASLMIRTKRWICSIKRHGCSGKWWSCGRHSSSYLPSQQSDCKYPTAQLIVQFRHRGTKNSMKNAVSESTAKQTLTVADTKMVTVKATFKDDIIKFTFPTSSCLSDLEHQVARRIKLKVGEFRLKYRDEENELILLACDDDLHHLLGFTANHSAIRLIVTADD